MANIFLLDSASMQDLGEDGEFGKENRIGAKEGRGGRG